MSIKNRLPKETKSWRVGLNFRVSRAPAIADIPTIKYAINRLNFSVFCNERMVAKGF